MATERDTSKSWWSNHHQNTSNHLVELQKEIKEEEEEIFADINSLINSHSNQLYSTLNDCDDDDDQHQQQQDPKEAKSFFAAAAAYQKPQITSSTTTATTATTITPTVTTQTANSTQAAIPNTLATTNTTTTINNNINIINNNHLRSYRSFRRDEQSFYSDDANEDEEDEDLLPDRYKIKKGANKAKTTTTTIQRDFRGNFGVAKDAAADDDEEASRDMDHFHIDSGPPPEEVDFMHQVPYLDGNLDPHDLGGHEIDDDPANYADGHKYDVDRQISQQNYQAFQAVIQHVTSNLPKPCVFFLEGNCRRSDCKYSHDLSNITCKYWIEGFCFKGEMCPFLHSYNAPLDPSDPNCLDEEGLNFLGKKELNPTFAIESEADFPSLPLDAPASALNDSTKSSNNTDSLTSNIKDQILSSNPAVVFKTVKKKRKKG